MEYLIILEESKNGYGAYAPDLPGVGVVGESREDALKSIKKAIELHIEDLQSQGKRIPRPKNHAVSLII